MTYLEFLRSFRDDESGATAMEYGLILAGIGVAVLVAVGTVGGNISSMFSDTIAPALE
ncbi:MAG: Flp family type IVb pilin [Parvibaculum sp.]|nr:Flp family type IVb pilin [Parvibaculum sp.]